MISEVPGLIRAVTDDENVIKWLKYKIRTAPIGEDLTDLRNRIDQAKRNMKYNNKILEQYYIHGISRDRLEKDIQQ